PRWRLRWAGRSDGASGHRRQAAGCCCAATLISDSSGAPVGAWDPGGDPGDDLIGDGAGRIGPVLSGGLTAGSRAEEYRPVPSADRRTVRSQVEGELVHA